MLNGLQKFHFNPDKKKSRAVGKERKKYSDADVSQYVWVGCFLKSDYSGNESQTNCQINGHFPKFPEAGFFVQIVAVGKSIQQKMKNN